MPDWTNTLARRQQGQEDGFHDVNEPREARAAHEAEAAEVAEKTRSAAKK